MKVQGDGQPRMDISENMLSRFNTFDLDQNISEWAYTSTMSQSTEMRKQRIKCRSYVPGFLQGAPLNFFFFGRVLLLQHSTPVVLRKGYRTRSVAYLQQKCAPLQAQALKNETAVPRSFRSIALASGFRFEEGVNGLKPKVDQEMYDGGYQVPRCTYRQRLVAYISRRGVIYPRIRYHCSLPEDAPSLGVHFEG